MVIASSMHPVLGELRTLFHDGVTRSSKIIDILHKSQIGFLANNLTTVVITMTGYFSKRDWQISYN